MYPTPVRNTVDLKRYTEDNTYHVQTLVMHKRIYGYFTEEVGDYQVGETKHSYNAKLLTPSSTSLLEGDVIEDKYRVKKIIKRYSSFGHVVNTLCYLE